MLWGQAGERSQPSTPVCPGTPSPARAPRRASRQGSGAGGTGMEGRDVFKLKGGDGEEEDGGGRRRRRKGMRGGLVRRQRNKARSGGGRWREEEEGWEEERDQSGRWLLACTEQPRGRTPPAGTPFPVGLHGAPELPIAGRKGHGREGPAALPTSPAWQRGQSLPPNTSTTRQGGCKTNAPVCSPVTTTPNQRLLGESKCGILLWPPGKGMSSPPQQENRSLVVHKPLCTCLHWTHEPWDTV